MSSNKSKSKSLRYDELPKNTPEPVRMLGSYARADVDPTIEKSRDENLIALHKTSRATKPPNPDPKNEGQDVAYYDSLPPRGYIAGGTGITGIPDPRNERIANWKTTPAPLENDIMRLGDQEQLIMPVKD